MTALATLHDQTAPSPRIARAKANMAIMVGLGMVALGPPKTDDFIVSEDGVAYRYPMRSGNWSLDERDYWEEDWGLRSQDCIAHSDSEAFAREYYHNWLIAEEYL